MSVIIFIACASFLNFFLVQKIADTFAKFMAFYTLPLLFMGLFIKLLELVGVETHTDTFKGIMKYALTTCIVYAFSCLAIVLKMEQQNNENNNEKN